MFAPWVPMSTRHCVAARQPTLRTPTHTHTPQLMPCMSQAHGYWAGECIVFTAMQGTIVSALPMNNGLWKNCPMCRQPAHLWIPRLDGWCRTNHQPKSGLVQPHSGAIVTCIPVVYTVGCMCTSCSIDIYRTYRVPETLTVVEMIARNESINCNMLVNTRFCLCSQPIKLMFCASNGNTMTLCNSTTC